jgi:predicted nuclease with TOPRIM domain
MNDLSETITSFLTVRDILRDSGDNPKMVDAALTLLDHYIEVQDETFTKAWNEVIKKPEDMSPWDHSVLDDFSKYDDEELEQTKKNYRAVIDEYNKLQSKYDELQSEFESLQDLFYRVDFDHDELKVSYAQCQDNYRAVVKSLKAHINMG